MANDPGDSRRSGGQSGRGSGGSRGRSGGGGRGRSGGDSGHGGHGRSGRSSDDRGRRDHGGSGRDRRPALTVQSGAPLPKWVREEITRSTPKDRREAALNELSNGLDSFADGRFKQAAAALRKAKALSPRAATVREILGLATYQTENWEESLRELRTFRRITGETIHMPVELDCLRALGRDGDVAKTFDLFLELGGDRDAEDEARVVFASHLLDQGRIADAWRVIKPGRLVHGAPSGAVRRWAVAARVAAASGDRSAASTLLEAVRREDPDAEWLSDFEAELDL